MPTFDFISNRDFRQSLESDYAELEIALQYGATKAVLVLAGSIVEALLADYLVAAGFKDASGKSVAELSLAQLIAGCSEKKVLSDTARDLCSVVKGYRNLIHPGRRLRLKETVDSYKAKAAEALVEIICGEMGKARSEERGPTAEQIVTKIESDSTAITILGHLLNGMSDEERVRLVLDALPQRYRELLAEADFETDMNETTRSFGICYGLAVDRCSELIGKKAAAKLASVVKNEAESVVLSFEDAFFRGGDLENMSVADRQIVKDHFLGRMKTPSEFIIRSAGGIGPHLAKGDVFGFYGPLIRDVANSTKTASKSRALVMDTYRTESVECDQVLYKALDAWITFYEGRDNQGAVTRIRALKSEVEPSEPDFGDEDIPF
jgi:hypothetical protein